MAESKVSAEHIENILSNLSLPIGRRMSALFDARHIGDVKAVNILINALKIDKLSANSSILFEHEVAYVLGQIGNTAASEHLMDILQDSSEDEMVRHEAAEALAAIGSSEATECLNQFVSDSSAPVRETCQLALRSLRLRKQKGNLTVKDQIVMNEEPDATRDETSTCKATVPAVVSNSTPPTLNCEDNPFNSVDPACALSGLTTKDIPKLGQTLLAVELPLWDRYQALFTLRNLGTSESVEAICDSLMHDKSSALFRHEVAFVLGQLQHKESISALLICLCNDDEHSMARHEAAMALGSTVAAIMASSENSLETCLNGKHAVIELLIHMKDSDQVVAESCETALDNIREELSVESSFDLLQHSFFSTVSNC